MGSNPQGTYWLLHQITGILNTPMATYRHTNLSRRNPTGALTALHLEEMRQIILGSAVGRRNTNNHLIN